MADVVAHTGTGALALGRLGLMQRGLMSACGCESSHALGVLLLSREEASLVLRRDGLSEIAMNRLEADTVPSQSKLAVKKKKVAQNSFRSLRHAYCTVNDVLTKSKEQGSTLTG